MKRDTIVIILLLLLLIFGVSNLFKYQIITPEILVENKDLFSAIESIITITAIIVGGMLSYFKFFRGRTFSTKADIEMNVSLIETPGNLIMHTIIISLVNRGNLTIWNPVTKIRIQQFNDTKNFTEEIIELFVEESLFTEKTKYESAVDQGETACFTFLREFEKSTWAVAYTAEIISYQKRKWQKTITVENKLNE